MPTVYSPFLPMTLAQGGVLFHRVCGADGSKCIPIYNVTICVNLWLLLIFAAAVGDAFVCVSDCSGNRRGM